MTGMTVKEIINVSSVFLTYHLFYFIEIVHETFLVGRDFASEKSRFIEEYHIVTSHQNTINITIRKKKTAVVKCTSKVL